MLRKLLVPVAALALLAGGVTVAEAAPGQSDNLARSATATASYTSPWESIAAVNDGIDPATSNDTANRRWGTWPNTGEQWVLLTWSAAQSLRAADVYFFDDNGGVRIPASWRLQSWNGSSYVDVVGASGYPTAVNQYNAVNFTPVSTSRLRLVLQSGAASVGVLELRAYTTAIGTGGGGTTGWTPPANLVAPLNQVWQHVESTYSNLYGFRNYGWDQVFANRGSINYCVRWDSSAPVSAALRDQIHASLARQFKKWMDVMAGHNGWPYQSVPLKVVGWAVRDRATLQWSDSSVDVYVNNIRENAPQCSEPCGRFFNQSGNYPNCPGGASHHYDMSLWLTAGMNGGAGGDWGQRVGSEYFVGALNSDNIHILLHEIGHSFGLDDFYDWTPTGVGGFLMKAGSASQITEFDAWMLRDWWRHLKDRYGY
ncbi:cellulose-binding protein [Dactylosporangium sp. NBC_01737]|uniref:cellulose-binding protein n=1 Tax=Dactylosporangium sp. NBC_01737 TaxID=2975959 RepID=UPI002E0FA74F|nr:cellulose-binding protein [Dactylosporangium sp. NBC_01737]